MLEIGATFDRETRSVVYRSWRSGSFGRLRWRTSRRWPSCVPWRCGRICGGSDGTTSGGCVSGCGAGSCRRTCGSSRWAVRSPDACRCGRPWKRTGWSSELKLSRSVLPVQGQSIAVPAVRCDKTPLFVLDEETVYGVEDEDTRIAAAFLDV